MDWNRFVVIGGQVAVLIVLGVLVALGHDSAILDGLMAVSGSLAGAGLYSAVKSAKATAPTADKSEGSTT